MGTGTAGCIGMTADAAAWSCTNRRCGSEAGACPCPLRTPYALLASHRSGPIKGTKTSSMIAPNPPGPGWRKDGRQIYLWRMRRPPAIAVAALGHMKCTREKECLRIDQSELAGPPRSASAPRPREHEASAADHQHHHQHTDLESCLVNAVAHEHFHAVHIAFNGR